MRRGIFQGDSLSPLWFGMAINPLSDILKSCNPGFKKNYNKTENRQRFPYYSSQSRLTQVDQSRL